VSYKASVPERAEDAEADDDAKPYDGPRRKHRHDLGHEDHGAKLAAGTTRAIQGLLGLWIALTFVFVVYAMVDAVSARTDTHVVPGSK
jgi:hypothetical protein